MLNISPLHMQVFNEQTQNRAFELITEDLLNTLRSTVPELIAKYPETDVHGLILEVVSAAHSFGVVDPGQLTEWTYIRLATNFRFYEGSAFEFVLTHPFLHAFAKGRHVAMAYFCIRKMEEERFVQWQ